jgi:hypothetical protein
MNGEDVEMIARVLRETPRLYGDERVLAERRRLAEGFSRELAVRRVRFDQARFHEDCELPHPRSAEPSWRRA